MTEQAPSATVVNSAKTSEVITDKNGRKLTVKKLNALENAKVGRAVGSDASMNQYYMTFALLSCCVRAIDGEPLMFPKTAEHVEAAIERLDDEGMEALMAWGQSNADNGEVVQTAKN